jgi:hypothetical protein
VLIGITHRHAGLLVEFLIGNRPVALLCQALTVFAIRPLLGAQVLQLVLWQADEVAAAMRRRLSRWLADGAQIERLPSEVEAAFVQRRTPDRLA